MKKTKDFSFARFFNPNKSPKTQIEFDTKGRFKRFEYFPKHKKYVGRLVWPASKGTYVSAIHGELK